MTEIMKSMWFDILKQRGIKVSLKSLESEVERWMMQNRLRTFTVDDIMDFIDINRIYAESVEQHNKYTADKKTIHHNISGGWPQSEYDEQRTRTRKTKTFDNKVKFFLPQLLRKNGYEYIKRGSKIWVKSSIKQSVLEDVKWQK
tara:strand:- start:2555 stop:2986 length:432 start_codon:yes stop_codon:yes gene_type:complete